MQPSINILEAMLHCPYKAWRLSKEAIAENNDLQTGNHPIANIAWQISQANEQVKSSKQHKQALVLLADTGAVLIKNDPPPFYKISHCSECRFKNDCYQKLIERDCISLLPSMTSKSILKYHNKGITTITQLSYLFKPRRRRAPNPQSSYLWELKALAWIFRGS